jgi:hypothetical protein
MLPWDFGVINAIKSELAFPIFPSAPPDGMGKTPYLIFELKSIQQCGNFKAKTEFSLTIIDSKDISGESLNILRNINCIIRKELVLSQSNSVIGSAKVKVDSIGNKKNCLIINLISILQLKEIYEDGGKNEQ